MAEGSRVRYKADYIWEAPDDGSRHEVIDGELCVSPPPAWRHQRYRSRLMLMVLGPVVYRDGLGEMVPAPKGVVLDEDSGVAPGLLFIRKERVGIIRERGRRGRPDWW